MRHHARRLVGPVALALVSALFLSACILVPVEDYGRRGDRDWHGDQRDRDWRGDHRR